MMSFNANPTVYFTFQLRNVEELGHLKQLTHLNHIFLKENPMMFSYNPRNGAPDDLIRSDLQQFSFYEYLQQTKTMIKTPSLKSNVNLICWLVVLFSFVNHRLKINRSCEEKSFSFEPHYVWVCCTSKIHCRESEWSL